MSQFTPAVRADGIGTVRALSTIGAFVGADIGFSVYGKWITTPFAPGFHF